MGDIDVGYICVGYLMIVEWIGMSGDMKSVCYKCVILLCGDLVIWKKMDICIFRKKF